MSTNTALDQIKNRVEGHSPTPWHHQPWGGQNENGDYSGGDVYDENGENVVSEVMDADGVLITAAPKLLAALEAVEGAVEAEVQRQRKESDRLWRRVLTRHPDRNFKTADRQEASAAGAEQVARHVRIAIQEALS